MKKGQYGRSGSHEFWYDYTKENILSGAYLIYIFKALINLEKIKINSEYKLLSIGMNAGVYERNLLKFLKKINSNCNFTFYLYDSEELFHGSQYYPDPDFKVLTSFDAATFSDKQIDMILDFRSSLWYASYTKFRGDLFWKSNVKKLIKSYKELLTQDGILLFDKAKLSNQHLDLARRNFKGYCHELSSKNIKPMLRANLLLEKSTFELIHQLKVVQQGEIIDTDKIIETIINSQHRKNYELNQISVCLLKK